MEIRVLRYFLEVARQENITRAAESLHISQPTLSKQLKDLESELGKKLFTRSNYSIKLTDEGMLLRRRAEDILAMVDKTTDEFKSLSDKDLSGTAFSHHKRRYRNRHGAARQRTCRYGGHRRATESVPLQLSGDPRLRYLGTAHEKRPPAGRESLCYSG